MSMLLGADHTLYSKELKARLSSFESITIISGVLRQAEK